MEGKKRAFRRRWNSAKIFLNQVSNDDLQYGRVLDRAMLVAPLLTPITGLALGSVRGRLAILKSAALGLAEGIVIAVLLSSALAWLAQALPFDASS